MITITHLSKVYPGHVQALTDLNLDIGTGMFGLIGPNGAGKTTLMRILAGLVRPSAGSVNVLGNDITTSQGKKAVKSVLGYLPQELGLYPDLSALEFLDYVAVLKGIINNQVRRAQVEEVMELVHLTDSANRRLRTFSGGMKRRVGIAQALLGNPMLLIVDEPSAGLDPEERVRLRNLFADLAANRTIILSTHIIEDISQSCNNLGILHRGRVIFEGNSHDLMKLASGKVWQVTTGGKKPNNDLLVVSTLQLGTCIQYRVLGEPKDYQEISPIDPSLEDGYIWLMHQAK